MNYISCSCWIFHYIKSSSLSLPSFLSLPHSPLSLLTTNLYLPTNQPITTYQPMFTCLSLVIYIPTFLYIYIIIVHLYLNIITADPGANVGTWLTKFWVDQMGFWSTLIENTSMHIDQITIDHFFQSKHISFADWPNATPVGSKKCF